MLIGNQIDADIEHIAYQGGREELACQCQCGGTQNRSDGLAEIVFFSYSVVIVV